jgi:hypothetical protein
MVALTIEQDRARYLGTPYYFPVAVVFPERAGKAKR